MLVSLKIASDVISRLKVRNVPIYLRVLGGSIGT